MLPKSEHKAYKKDLRQSKVLKRKATRMAQKIRFKQKQDQKKAKPDALRAKAKAADKAASEKHTTTCDGNDGKGGRGKGKGRGRRKKPVQAPALIDDDVWMAPVLSPLLADFPVAPFSPPHGTMAEQPLASYGVRIPRAT
jgi:hypothetical protein